MTSDELNRPGQEEKDEKKDRQMERRNDGNKSSGTSKSTSNHCESAVRGNRISSTDYDKQLVINCNMRWGFSRTAE